MMQNTGTRDLTKEHDDTEDRKYAYEFDYVLRDYMIRTFKPFLPKGRALEMGCYEGEFTKVIMQHFNDVTVIEGAQDLLELCQAKMPSVKFIHGYFETVEMTEKFDAIFLMHTLEHLDDPVGVLARINEWLTPTGRLILAVPNANAPSRQIAVRMGLIDHNAAVTEGERLHGHRCTYGLDTLQRDAKAAGLKVVHQGGIFFKPFANFQFDKLMKTDIIDDAYLEGCYELGMLYPDLCASIYCICEKG